MTTRAHSRSSTTGSYRRRRAVPREWATAAKMAGVFAVLIGTNAYVFFFRGKTSLPELQRSAERRALPAAHIGDGPPRDHENEAAPIVTTSAAATPPRPLPRELTGGPGDVLTLSPQGRSVEKMLTDEKFARAALTELPLDLRSFQPSSRSTLYVTVDRDGRLAGIDIIDNNGEGEYWRRSPGGWLAQHDTRHFASRRVTATTLVGVGSSLAESLRRAGEQPQLADLALRALASEIEAPTELEPHDRLRLLVEKQTISGQFLRYGRLLAIEWTSERRGVWRAFRYGNSTDGEFFGEHGESSRHQWLHTPVEIGAGIATRTAPGEWKVAAGAPIWSMSQGRVVFITRGKSPSVTIADDEGLQLTYRGPLRLAAALSVGTPIRQGQRLGAITGTSTTTLNVEARRDGRAIDLRSTAPRAAAVDAKMDRARFGETVAALLNELSTNTALASAIR